MGVALFAGSLYAAATPAFGQAYLAFVCLIPIYWLLDDPRLSSLGAVACGYAFGLVTELAALGWVYHALRHGAELPVIGALTGYIGLGVAKASLFSVWAFAVRALSKRGVKVGLAGPVLLVLCEWLMPMLAPTRLAHTAAHNRVLAQTLDLIGPLGLTFIIASINALLFALLPRRPAFRHTRLPPLAATVTIALLLGSILYGVTVVRDVGDTAANPKRELRVGVIQALGNARHRKNPALYNHQLELQSEEAARQGAELLLWPQATARLYPGPRPLEVASTCAARLGLPIVLLDLRGRALHDEARLATCVLIDASGAQVAEAPRALLRPMVDFIPFATKASQSPVKARISIFEIEGLRVGVLHSYEELFAARVRELMQHDPDLIVVLGDDWLGDGFGTRVHQSFAVMRAIEHRRYLVRATPSGVSAIIDPTGRVIAESEMGVRANIVRTVSAMPGLTLYGLMGDWPVVVLCFGALAFWLAPELIGRVAAFTRGRRRARS